MNEPEMIRFKKEICNTVLRLNMLHMHYGIESNITTIAALKLLARILELSSDKFTNRDQRGITLGEIDDYSKELVEIGMKELDFILADNR